MGLVTWIATYIIVWWILFFMVLPWGNQAAEGVPVGFEQSAPENPRVILKIGITCLLAAGVCTFIHFGINKGWIDLKTFFSEG